MEMPPIPTYDNIENTAREAGRNDRPMCWEFYCQDCGKPFGSCNDIGVAEYTMKRLQKIDCETCGSKNWAMREVGA